MSNNRHKYFNKVPPFKPDPEHYTRKQHSWKAKEAYETEDDAWEYLNQNPKLKAEGMTVYRCRTCTKCADTFHQMCRHFQSNVPTH